MEGQKCTPSRQGGHRGGETAPTLEEEAQRQTSRERVHATCMARTGGWAIREQLGKTGDRYQPMKREHCPFSSGEPSASHQLAQSCYHWYFS